MKKLLFTSLLILVGFVFTTNTLSQILSNGTGGGDWNTGSTWIGSTVPTVSDNVVIQGSDVVTITTPGTGSCANLTMAAGTKITLSTATLPGTSWTLNAASTVEYVGANPPAFVYANYGNLIWSAGAQSLSSNLTVNANLSVTGTTAKLKGTGTAVTLVHTVAGNVTVSSTVAPAFVCVDNANGSVTWNIGGNLIIDGIVSGFASAGCTTTATAIINVTGGLTINATGTLQYGHNSLNASPFTLSVKGNFTSSGTIIKKAGVAPGTWVISMDGTTVTQNLAFVTGTSAKSSGVLCTLRVNNPYGVTLTAPMLLDQNWTLDLSGGKLYTDATNIVTVGTLSGAGFVNASSTNFVSGPVAYQYAAIGSPSFIYPIGKGSAYRPVTLSLSQSAVTASTYTAEMFNAAPPANSLPGTGTLDKVSSVRYYTISEGAGGSAFTAGAVTLSYEANDGVTQATTLRVAQGPAGSGTWTDLGGTGSAAPTGTILSTVAFTDLTTDTVFTLANATGGTNALPVELTSFTAAAKDGVVELAWTVATETNNYGWDIETRKNSETSWEKVGFINGAGNSTSINEYFFCDKFWKQNGTYLYRLKQIDFNGKFEYSTELMAVIDLPQHYSLSQNYPNPFNPSTNIAYTLPMDSKVTLAIYSLIGEKIADLVNEEQASGYYSYQFSSRELNLTSGVYIYKLTAVSKSNDLFSQSKKMLLLK